jgi:hypothetical protein
MAIQIQNITPENNLFPVVVRARGTGFSVSGATGTIAAALTANNSIFAMRFDPSATPARAFIERIRIQYSTIVAYTTPVTAGRRLAIFRGTGAAASGGTALVPAKKLVSSTDSEFTAAAGGDIRIAATAGLTVTGITFEADPIRTMSLVHVGAAGAFYDRVFEFGNGESAPIQLEAGQLLAIRNPAAMDAAGTWQAVIDVDWYEI